MSIPALVRQLSGNETPQLVWTNERGGLTFRAGTRFIKWNPHETGLNLEAERLRLQWAARWHTVPKVLDWGITEETQWMVTYALAGDNAVTEPWLSRPLEAASAIGRGLYILHDTLPVENCPFDWSVETRTGHRVPIEDLAVPLIDRLVVCHGDACAPNTIISPNGAPTGHVDLGLLGIADRWADLAVASMNLDYNYGPGWEEEFFTAYGIERDETRLSYYRYLWENEDRIGISSDATLGLIQAHVGKPNKSFKPKPPHSSA